jgi:hypothetical protein
MFGNSLWKARDGLARENAVLPTQKAFAIITINCKLKPNDSSLLPI